jgi:hypothetical protein
MANVNSFVNPAALRLVVARHRKRDAGAQTSMSRTTPAQISKPGSGTASVPTASQNTRKRSRLPGHEFDCSMEALGLVFRLHI